MTCPLRVKSKNILIHKKIFIGDNKMTAVMLMHASQLINTNSSLSITFDTSLISHEFTRFFFLEI